MSATIPTAAAVYVKHQDIANVDGNLPLALCSAMNSIVPGGAICAQRMGQYWHLFPANDDSRLTLIQSGGLQLEDILVNIYDTLPNNGNTERILNERIVFKNVPFDVDNEVLRDFLKQKHKQIVLKSDILFAKIRDDGQLTSYYNGDRFAYVRGQFEPSLPKNCAHNGMKFRIWHRSQETVKCARCNSTNHNSNQTDKCPNFRLPIAQDMVVFQSRDDPLSNFWKSPFPLHGLPEGTENVQSAEQAYQYLKCKTVKYDQLATQILECQDPADQKPLAHTIPVDVLNTHHWHQQKLDIMRNILKAKSTGCADFRKRLIETGYSPLVEAGANDFWASGLNYRLTKTTVMESYPGSNNLGKLLMEMRTDIALIISEYDSADDSAINTPATSRNVSDAESDQEVQPLTPSLQRNTDDHTEKPQNVKTDELIENQQSSKSVKHNLRSKTKSQSLAHTVTTTKTKNNLHAQTLNKIWERQSKKKQSIPVDDDVT